MHFLWTRSLYCLMHLGIRPSRTSPYQSRTHVTQPYRCSTYRIIYCLWAGTGRLCTARAGRAPGLSYGRLPETAVQATCRGGAGLTIPREAGKRAGDWMRIIGGVPLETEEGQQLIDLRMWSFGVGFSALYWTCCLFWKFALSSGMMYNLGILRTIT